LTTDITIPAPPPLVSIYAVTVSSRVTGGASETLCAHVLSPPEPLALRVTLEAQSGSTVILEETVSTDYYGCSTFQVCSSSREIPTNDFII
jgi:hypothetical protein